MVERVLGRLAADVAGDEIGPDVAAEVPRRRVRVGGPEVVDVAAEHVDGRLRQVGHADRRRVITSPQPPSDVIAQSRRWNGSATMRLSRMSWTVNGPRPW